ncbi:ASCH domain-containing protein [Isoptericola sp. G70]|uniref:ASCH domain-containing protein n=1 Tax=Isoptericola sp. G70 TaxID=3376633 RepID=UPI003A810850
MTDDDVTSGHTPPTGGQPSDDPGSGLPPLDDTVQAEEITRFWDTARPSAGRTSHGGSVGERAENVVPPPAWAFGDSPALANELLELVLEGTKTATASLVVEYENVSEQLPRRGDLSILLDGGGVPRALIRTTEVETLPFAEVTAEHAWAEGEDDRSLETWREQHERYWRRTLAGTDHEFDTSVPVVCEQFEVLYSE